MRQLVIDVAAAVFGLIGAIIFLAGVLFFMVLCSGCVTVNTPGYQPVTADTESYDEEEEVDEDLGPAQILCIPATDGPRCYRVQEISPEQEMPPVLPEDLPDEGKPSSKHEA